MKRILITSENDDDIVRSVMFQMAVHLSSVGQRVLYITTDAISALPPSINDNAPTVNTISLVTFLYVKEREALIANLSGLKKIHRPPRVIIMENMGAYAQSLPELTSVAAVLCHAADVCTYRHKSPSSLFVSYRSPVPAVLERNFFQHMWCVHRQSDSITLQTHIGRYTFEEDTEGEAPSLRLKEVWHKQLIDFTKT